MCAPTAQREPHCAPREPHKDHPLHSNKKRPSRGVECPIIRIYCCAVQKETRRQRGEATPAPARQYFAAPGESRSEASRVGEEGGSTCRFRWRPYPYKKKTKRARRSDQ